jgi:anti-sigma regulatory factor (Ser/Thr protein kinase)
VTVSPATAEPVLAPRHEAYLHRGDGEFVEGAVAFVRDGLARDEPVLVVATPHKLDLLRGALRRDAGRVAFADMQQVGANPARIIPAWRTFTDRFAAGRRLRGIGEPIWPQRRGAELAECHVHEALLNRALAGTSLWLLCPYDVGALDRAVVERARHTHPELHDRAGYRASGDFESDDRSPPLAGSLPDPPRGAALLAFDATSLPAVRRATARAAARAGLRASRVADAIMAVSEVAANTVCHGGGRGTLRTWTEPDRLLCEVRDAGRIDDAMAGRVRPGSDEPAARGLWLCNQVCDLVQLRTSAAGTVVRLHR